jgi:alpha-amylase/alpha-mannosidase (GH57 family)
MPEVYHAIGLSMHQPPGNLLTLHNSAERHEVKQILWCYDRVTRMLEGYDDVARLMMMFSGTLLKQLEDPAIAETFHDVIDVGEMLARYQRCQNIEFLGSGLYHPVFPLIPEADWDAQTGWWHGLGKKLLGREWFPGFCPPEIAFSQEMIPTLKRMGYRYVIVDCWYIKPRREMRWDEIRYRPHVARYGDDEIIVVPLDRELSNAQSSGTSPWWLENEIKERTKHCDFPALVTTWSDGENGGWFRNPNIEASFWGHLYRPLCDKQRAGELHHSLISINEYLDRHGPGEEVDLHPGAWNTDHHWGGDFMQWTGSLLQKRGFEEIESASAYYHRLSEAFHQAQGQIPEADTARQTLHEAYDTLLAAETSCNFYWGSGWVHKSFDLLERCYQLLDEVKERVPDFQ